MTPDQMLTIIKARLGNWTDTAMDTAVYLEMTLAQQRLERGPELPWFLFTDDTTSLDTVAGTETVGVPTGFLREYEDSSFRSALFYYDATLEYPWKPLKKDDYGVLKDRYPGTGTPGYYDLLGSNFYLRPTPEKASDLRLLFYKSAAPAFAAGGAANAWSTYAPNLIIAETGLVIAGQYVFNDKAAAVFEKQRQEELHRLTVENVARFEAMRASFMGEN